MALFLRKRIYGYNESVRSDGVIVAWKADNSKVFILFSGIGAPNYLSDKDFFSKKRRNTLGKWRLILAYRYSPGRVNNTFFAPK